MFAWLVFEKGQTSNGVGPTQITYKGYLLEMERQGLHPWAIEDNMRYGFRLLKANYDATGNWAAAGARYNGGPRPNAAALAYGRDLDTKVTTWKKRLGIIP